MERQFLSINYKLIGLLLITVFLVSCEGKKDVEFVKVEDVVVKQLNQHMIRLEAISVFNNPNPLGITIDSWDIDVTANGIEVAKVDLDVPTTIPANGYFLIPISVRFPPKKVLNIKGGIVAGVLSAIQNKSITLEFKGFVYANLAGKKIPVKVQAEKEVLL